MRCDVWFPSNEDAMIRQILDAHPGQALLLDDHMKHGPPPTFFRTTQFTDAFQTFVDTYGIARYKEANPAVLTIVTLPFLFGIMFGDIGHGGVVLLFGMVLVLFNKTINKLEGDLVKMLAGARYMILLMGFYATFAGFLYNDFFSLGLDIFGTRYAAPPAAEGAEVAWTPNTGMSFPYPFGFDPVWKGAKNELLFFNSFKMKFAVIVAGVQMGVGVLIKGLNCVYFQDHLSFVFEFVPQLIFFTSFVGYMNFLIFWKWLTPEGSNKPNIINTLINMGLNKPVESPMFAHQDTVQKFLLLGMLVAVPVMLLPKPLILKSLHNKQIKETEYFEQDSLLEMGGAIPGEEPFDFGEEFIHQMIETIEFVLGTVSNTASYLRLWALSLAHQQLSLVFFEKTVLAVLEKDFGIIVGTIVLFFAFGMFAMATFGVMLGMDSLECFLHALRLQWVEFQSKFFKADGYNFRPVNFARLLARGEDGA
ncbi:MAG: hypothetical protein KVP17_004891 [Porospora cf. gigantea B]|nr:MAG: hypothetical protein KVP17_004891 [Porospora cf. gigantea B]